MINDNHGPSGCASVPKIAIRFHAENQDFRLEPLFLNDVNVYTHAMKHMWVSLRVQKREGFE